MTKEKFIHHLAEATKQVIEFTKSLCHNNLSDNCMYTITPSSRTVAKEDKHLNELEIAVLETWNKMEGQLLTANEVVDLIHHDNKVPVWINITVYESRPEMTVIDLFCSTRLREEKELMHQGLHPFHMQVSTPPDHLRAEIDGKFDVNWKKNSNEAQNNSIHGK